MPIYEFKCGACGRKQEVILSFSEHTAGNLGPCKKCNKVLTHADQQINFVGGINMNNSTKAKAYRKYSNKQGGPQGIIGGTPTGKGTVKKGGINVGRTGLV